MWYKNPVKRTLCKLWLASSIVGLLASIAWASTPMPLTLTNSTMIFYGPLAAILFSSSMVGVSAVASFPRVFAGRERAFTLDSSGKHEPHSFTIADVILTLSIVSFVFSIIAVVLIYL